MYTDSIPPDGACHFGPMTTKLLVALDLEKDDIDQLASHIFWIITFRPIGTLQDFLRESKKKIPPKFSSLFLDLLTHEKIDYVGVHK